MAKYKCFFCGKQLSSKDLQKRFMCSHCGSRVFFKPRTVITKIKAV